MSDRTKVRFWMVVKNDAADGELSSLLVAALNEADAVEAAARYAAKQHGQDGWTHDKVEVEDLTPTKLESDWTEVIWEWGVASAAD